MFLKTRTPAIISPRNAPLFARTTVLSADQKTLYIVNTRMTIEIVNLATPVWFGGGMLGPEPLPPPQLTKANDAASPKQTRRTFTVAALFRRHRSCASTCATHPVAQVDGPALFPHAAREQRVKL